MKIQFLKPITYQKLNFEKEFTEEKEALHLGSGAGSRPFSQGRVWSLSLVE